MVGKLANLNLEASVKDYFTDKGVMILNLEEIRSSRLFNSTTYFTVQCAQVKKHTYRTCVMKLRSGKDIVTDCPHCKKDKKFSKDRIPVIVFQNYADKNNLTIENGKEFYSRWVDSITFICNSCTESHIVKALSHFEENTSKTDFTCPSCRVVALRNNSKNIVSPESLFSLTNSNKENLISYIKSTLSDSIKLLDSEILVNGKFTITYCDNIKPLAELYHQEKLDKCTATGIRLITMFDDEWINKKDICKSRIRNVLGLTMNKIFARKCEVRKISNEVALLFCSTNHIQGKGQANKSYGLFYNDKLVSAMTFSLPSASKSGKKKDYDWELNRFCSDLDTVVIGGANRLLAAFRGDYPKERIMTFCDLRWGSGNVYEKMGFKFLYRTRPNYYYIGEYTNWQRKHRFGFTKQKLISLFNETDVTLTEKEIATKNGLFQMHDCGHLKYILE